MGIMGISEAWDGSETPKAWPCAHCGKIYLQLMKLVSVCLAITQKERKP